MSGPLEGYRTLEMSQITTGPLTTMLLADQGIEVILVAENVRAGPSLNV